MALTTDERERLIDELEGVLVPATRALPKPERPEERGAVRLSRGFAGGLGSERCADESSSAA